METIPDPIAEIRDELFRLKARSLDVGPIDAIGFRDDGNGRATLHGSVKRLPFDWYGDVAEILERLRGLPDGSGPEAIRSEFA
jgi:hypothetical protein